MKSKRILISLLIVLVLIGVGVLVYFKFIKKDNGSKENNDKKTENVINDRELNFKISKEIEGIYDDFKNESFSNKKIDTVDDITAKISDKKIVVSNDSKSIDVTDIGTPKYIRLVDGYNLTDTIDTYVLYILNNEKDLYKVEIELESFSILSKEKIQENIDEFNSIEGAFKLLTYALDSNKVLLTKSGEELRLNGKDINEFKGIILSYPEIVIIYDSKDNKFIKIDDKELVAKAVLVSYDKRKEDIRNIYVVTVDNEVYVFTDTEKNTYTYIKKENKFSSLEINNSKATIIYENKEEDQIELSDRSYYDGKIYDFILNK